MTDATRRRLEQARDDLRRIPDVYSAALLLGYGMAARPLDSTRSSKPTSRAPSGADTALRGALVRALRHIADAHADIEGVSIHPWEPLYLGRPHWRDDLHVETTSTWLVTCRLDRTRSWTPDPDDLLLVLPGRDTVTGACSLLSARLSEAHTRGLDVRDAHRAIDRARGVLVAQGVWEPPAPDPDDPVCAHCLEKVSAFGLSWCWRCKKAHVRLRCHVCGLGVAA